jgi:hypothetical protein
LPWAGAQWESAISIFEYITVATSLVLSLGLVRLLEGSLSAFSPSRTYPIHAVWVVLKFVNHFMYWWMLWGFRGGAVEWNFPLFLFSVLPAVVLYLQATLLVSSSPGEVASWREHYYSIAPPFFALNVVYLLLSNSFPWVAENYIPPTRTLILVSLAAVAWIAAMLSRKPGVHLAVTVYAALLNVLAMTILIFTPPPD